MLSINFRDIVSGGSCTFDPETNLPDSNCVFVPSLDDNDDIRSSYMAVPFLPSVDHFSMHTETAFHHDPYKPNKQNFMCDQRATWSVIMENIDFQGVNPMGETPPDTIFRILKPDEGRFALVLDRSGSMGDQDRMVRLKQSTTRWIKYDLDVGTYLAVTSFSSDFATNKRLTAVTDANRNEFVAAVESLVSNGGTCLGLGLMEGMDVRMGRFASI